MAVIGVQVRPRPPRTAWRWADLSSKCRPTWSWCRGRVAYATYVVWAGLIVSALALYGRHAETTSYFPAFGLFGMAVYVGVGFLFTPRMHRPDRH